MALCINVSCNVTPLDMYPGTTVLDLVLNPQVCGFHGLLRFNVKLCQSSWKHLPECCVPRSGRKGGMGLSTGVKIINLSLSYLLIH